MLCCVPIYTDSTLHTLAHPVQCVYICLTVCALYRTFNIHMNQKQQLIAVYVGFHVSKKNGWD